MAPMVQKFVRCDAAPKTSPAAKPAPATRICVGISAMLFPSRPRLRRSARGLYFISSIYHEDAAMSSAPAADKLLDTKGLNCPLPVLRAKKALVDLAAGGVLRVEATDPGASRDFESFCQAQGHQLLSSTTEGNTL